MASVVATHYCYNLWPIIRNTSRRRFVFPPHFVALFTPSNASTSGILQGHCKVPTIARLESHDETILLSALHTLLLEIYAGSLPWPLFLLTLRMRLLLAHHAFSNFLSKGKLSSRNCTIHLRQRKTRTAFTCKLAYECISNVADGSCRLVWAPASISGFLKPVIIWFHGG